MPRKLSHALRLLRDAGSVDDEEYAELLRISRSRKKMTAKQKATALRNLRRGCKKIMKPKAAPRGSKTEQKVKKLRSEIRETVRQENLKIELQELRAQRRQIRDFKKAFRNREETML